ncbi:MAG: Fe-S cluster assembly protein SufD [Acidobacteriota bacterium]
MGTIAQVTELGSLLVAFNEIEQRTLTQPGWIRSLRRDAFTRFCDVGFPTTKDEDWRFTSVASISGESFSLPKSGRTSLTLQDVQPFLIPRAACVLVFVNGRFRAELSTTELLPTGITAGSVADAIANGPATLEAHLGRYVDIQRDAFCSLNTALFEDGAYVRAARGTVLEAPVHLLYVSTAAGTPEMAHPRNLLVAESETQINIVEEHVSLSSGVFFSNVVTELIAGENAVVSHHMIERESRNVFHFSTLRMQQDRNSNVSSHSVLIGGALVRNNVHPVLGGEGGECLINGLFLGDDRQHMDNYMLVEHVSPHCNSRQFYNGILDGHAHGVFHGRIVVHQEAQKTNAKQTNRNLLLSDSAQIDTKPQLEIYADDVKCTHGATIGQIDEHALFYLRSRGIDEQAARGLLLFAFAGECLGRLKSDPIRKHIERIVHLSLPAGIRPVTEDGLEMASR